MELVSDYERERELNIQKNNEYLQSLGLLTPPATTFQFIETKFPPEPGFAFPKRAYLKQGRPPKFKGQKEKGIISSSEPEKKRSRRLSGDEPLYNVLFLF